MKLLFLLFICLWVKNKPELLNFFLTILVYFRIYFSGLVINLYVIAANADPINGAIINTHTCFNASPPAITAGARLLAGFTDVPVNFIPIICTNANVSPITIPATDDFFASDVTPNIVNMNTNVKIISQY